MDEEPSYSEWGADLIISARCLFFPIFASLSFWLVFSTSYYSNCCYNSNLISPITSKSASHGATLPLMPTKCCLSLWMPPPLIKFLQYLQYIFPSTTSAWVHAGSFDFRGILKRKWTIHYQLFKKNWKKFTYCTKKITLTMIIW